MENVARAGGRGQSRAGAILARKRPRVRFTARYCTGYYLYAEDDGVGEYQCEEVLARGQDLALLAGEAEEAEGDVHEESAAAELDAREEGKAAEERRVLPKGGYANQD